MIKRFLEHHALQGLDLDHPGTTLLRRRIIREKPFLQRLYRDFYAQFQEAAGRAPEGPCLEVGTGGGFLKDLLPRVLASEVFFLPGLDLVLDAQRLPSRDHILAAIFLLDVFHHLDRPLAFLREARRCLLPGGRLLMIEPMNTAFSRLVYRRLHHEPFDPEAQWGGGGDKPLSQANSALPWIMFFRDREACLEAVGGLELVSVRPHTPLAYLLSGGVSLRSLLPGCLYGPLRALEQLLSPLDPWLAMFVTIELKAVHRP